MSKTKTDLSPYIVNVQGKDFVTFAGLLQEAHAQGLVSIETNMVNEDFSNPVFKSTTVFVQDGVEKHFTGYGDANSSNVAKKVVSALIRMAETRSLARSLRFACNIDMTAIEELDSEENVIVQKNNNKSNTQSTLLKKPTLLKKQDSSALKSVKIQNAEVVANSFKETIGDL